MKRKKSALTPFPLCIMFLYLSLLGSVPSYADGKITMQGYVRNSETSEPISFVNVFLAGTTRGTTTDDNGYYEIKFILPGAYDVVASMMGYEMERKSVRLMNQATVKMDFRLKPMVLEAPTLEVSADVPHAWKVDLKLFEELFIGKTANASKCKIQNPEVLTFRRAEGNFAATASHPLLIENSAIGMELVYILEEFVYMSDLKIMYRGVTQFKPLASDDDKQSEKWEENRRKTFYGSLRHFLIALSEDRLKEEGFLVHERSDLPRRISQRRDYMHGVEIDSLISRAGIPEEMFLHFDDLLQVYDSRRNVTSWIQLAYDSVLFNHRGMVYDPYAIRTFGYWSTLGIAELLPHDYLPESLR